jgi:hypothetical protein
MRSIFHAMAFFAGLIGKIFRNGQHLPIQFEEIIARHLLKGSWKESQHISCQFKRVLRKRDSEGEDIGISLYSDESSICSTMPLQSFSMPSGILTLLCKTNAIQANLAQFFLQVACNKLCHTRYGNTLNEIQSQQ